jgi:hypothetical protein
MTVGPAASSPAFPDLEQEFRKSLPADTCTYGHTVK